MNKTTLLIFIIAILGASIYIGANQIVRLIYSKNELITLDKYYMKIYNYHMKKGDEIKFSITVMEPESFTDIVVISSIPKIDVSGEFPNIGSNERIVWGPANVSHTQNITIKAGRDGIYIIQIKNPTLHSITLIIKINVEKLSIPENRIRNLGILITTISLIALIIKVFFPR